MTTIRNIVEEMRQDTAYCEYWQRAWSWTKSHIATLWDSLFKGHPIGLFTFWEQETPEGQVHKLIVDGQQHLLSIYTAMENALPPTILPNAPAPAHPSASRLCPSQPPVPYGSHRRNEHQDDADKHRTQQSGRNPSG